MGVNDATHKRAGKTSTKGRGRPPTSKTPGSRTPNAQLLEARAKQWDRIQLGVVIDELLLGKVVRGWEPGKAFEYAILRAFELDGADVVWPFEVKLEGSPVEQIDGAVHCRHISCIVEAKHEAEPVNIEPIAKLRAQLSRRPPGTIGLLFAWRGLTRAAKTLTRYLTPMQVLTWEGEELREAFSRSAMVDGLIRKHRHAVEHGLPDFSLLPPTSPARLR